MKTRYFSGILILLFFLISSSVYGKDEQPEHNSEEEFNASSFIIEHISDSHEWHIYTKKNGDHVAIYLPVILFSKETELQFFSSKKLAHGHEYKGFRLAGEGKYEGRIIMVDERGQETLPLDFSMTKSVIGMLFAAIIGLWLFISLSRSYRKTGVSYPRGIQSFLEPIVLFVRDDIAIPNIGEEKHEKFMPYLLSVFFFILINNLMGLIPFPPPFGANVTGNIAVTMTLALFTFFIIQFNGSRSYWKHLYATPGVPFWLVPIMFPVEIIGMLAKPFALMVRLFANITAGHIIVMSLISIIFIFKSVAIAPVSAIFVIFMDCLELLVAFLQAYVFTLLSALFISLAVKEEHH